MSVAGYVLILTTLGATEPYKRPQVTIAYDSLHRVAVLRIELVDPSPEGIDVFFKDICQASPKNTRWLFAAHLSTQSGQRSYSWSDTNETQTDLTSQITGRCYLILAGSLSTDRDYDGLTDVQETYLYGTNPANPDSDGDGRTDGWEIAHHQDPLDPANGIKSVVTEIETVTLAWNAHANPNVVGYNVYRRDHLRDSDQKLDLRIDGYFEDWTNISRINRYPYPPKAELFLKDMWVANDDQNLYFRIRSFDIHHQTFVFLDVDQNRKTGTQPFFRGLPIGADFRLRVAELDTNGVQVFLDPYNPAFAPWLRPRPDDEEAFLVSTTPLTNALYRLGNDDFNRCGLQNNGLEVQIPFAALGAVFPAGLVGVDLYFKMHSDYFPNVDYAPGSPSYYRYGYHRLNPAPVQENRFQDRTSGGVEYDYAITALLGDGGEVLVKSEEAVYVSRANPSCFDVSVVGTNTLGTSWFYPEHAAIAGVRIVRGTDHFPTNQDDGITVYEGTGTRYVDKGLSPATAYFYSAFGYTAEREFSAGCWDAKDRSMPAAPRGPIAGLDSTSDYLVYFGNWDDQRVRQAHKYKLVILHPGGGSPLISPEQVRDIRAGADHIFGTADDVKVIAYLSIGEDYGRPNPQRPGYNDPRTDLPAEFNDGLGPCYFDRDTGQIVFEKRGYPSFYVDEYDLQTNGMAGHDFYPDQNQEWGGFYVNSGDPKWQAFQKVATYETDGFAGLDYLAHTLKVDGFYLDTVGVSVPWSYWNTYRGDYYWIRDGHLDYLAKIGYWYPEKIIMPNRPDGAKINRPTCVQIDGTFG